MENNHYVFLKELIEWLEKQPQEAVLPYGFGEPMSYAGSYESLAFEPKENAKISDMLEYARSALNCTFKGYKGGNYTMDEYSDCYIADYGYAGSDKIGCSLLNCWEYIIKNKHEIKGEEKETSNFNC